MARLLLIIRIKFPIIPKLMRVSDSKPQAPSGQQGYRRVKGMIGVYALVLAFLRWAFLFLTIQGEVTARMSIKN